jgi:hypothetical protein
MLKTGYNLVHGRAVEAFRADVERRYGYPQPETLSLLALLRRVRRAQPLPHKAMLITGLPALWRLVPQGEHEALGRMLFRFLQRHMNWLQNQNYYLYFAVPDEVTFNNAGHLYLRFTDGAYADMTMVFGHLTQENSEHYHHNFNVSQV